MSAPSDQICVTCRCALAEPDIDECLECWAAVPANTDRAMRKMRAGLPFRQAKQEALRDFVAERARRPEQPGSSASPDYP